MEDKILEFKYEEKSVLIQCNTKEKMKEIINKFSLKTGEEKESLIFLFAGQIIKEDLTLKEIIPTKYNNSETIQILVYSDKPKPETIIK